MDSVFENNILLTQTERLMMSGRPKQPKYARNKNILVIGGSGERVIIVIPHESAVNTRASAA